MKKKTRGEKSGGTVPLSKNTFQRKHGALTVNPPANRLRIIATQTIRQTNNLPAVTIRSCDIPTHVLRTTCLGVFSTPDSLHGKHSLLSGP